MQSIKLHVPPRPVLVDTYNTVHVVDQLIGREFIIDPTWVPRDNLDQSPPLHRVDDIVYTIKKLSKTMNSVWFDYEEDDCRCVPIRHISIIPYSHEIPPADGFDTSLLSAWSEVWQDWIDATDRVERLERCQKRRVDELCESIDEIQKLRKALTLNSQKAQQIISGLEQKNSQGTLMALLLLALFFLISLLFLVYV